MKTYAQTPQFLILLSITLLCSGCIRYDRRLRTLKHFSEDGNYGQLRLNGFYVDISLAEKYTHFHYFYANNTYTQMSLVARDSVESKRKSKVRGHPKIYRNTNSWGFYTVKNDEVFMSETSWDQGTYWDTKTNAIIKGDSLIKLGDISKSSFGRTNGKSTKITKFVFRSSLYKPDSSHNPYLNPKMLAKLRRLHT